MLAAVVLLTFALGRCAELPTGATELIGRMCHEVTLKYFMGSNCLVLATEDNNKILDYMYPLDFPTFHIQLPLPFKKTAERLDVEFETYAWDKFFMAPSDAGCLAFIIQTSDVKFMVQTFARLAHSPRSMYRANRKFLFVPSRDMEDTVFETGVKEVFSIRERDFFPDLVIAKLVAERNMISNYSRRVLPFPDSSNAVGNLKLELITHRFVGQNPSERVSLDMWMPTMEFLFEVNLYPDKTSDLMGKHITITTMHYPPLTIVDEDANPPVYEGLELRFIYEWARATNFTWSIVYDGGWWGDVWPNGSGDGLCGLVSSDIADVGFSAIYLWDNIHLFVDFSSIYFGSSLTVVTPRPKLLPGWMVPIHPFNPDMWYAIGMSVIGCTVVLYITSKTSMRLLGRGMRNNVVNMYSSWVECAFRTMGLLVLQVPPDERDYSTPRHVPMRHLVTWLILFYFVTTTAYCGGLATVLTLPRYEKPIESVSDLADHNLIWGGMDDAFTFIMRGSSDPKVQTVVRNFRLESREYLTARAKAGDMGFVIERMLGGHFYLPSFINEETMQRLRVMKGDLYFSHTVYILRKGSPLEASINTMIQRVRDAGLFVFWEGLTVRNYMSTPRQLSVINSRDEEDMGPTKLLLRHVSGAFYMLGVCLAVSSATFIFELVRFKFRQIVENRLNKIAHMQHKNA